MSQFDATDYFNRLSTSNTPLENSGQAQSKFNELIDAKQRAVSALNAKALAMEQRRLEIEEASKNSWATKLGLDPSGAAYTVTNLAGSALSGATRQAGDLGALPLDAAAQAYDASLTNEEIEAIGRHKLGTATPEDLALISRPRVSQAQQVDAMGNTQPTSQYEGLTPLQMFDQANAARVTGQDIRKAADYTSVVHQGRRSGLTDDLGAGFGDAWGQVKTGFGAVTDGDLTGSVDMVAGLAKLIYNAGEAAVNNPGAAAEYIAENTPQLLLGGLGVGGKVAMTAANVGYASDNYEKAILRHQAENKGAYPDAGTRQQMAAQAAGLALAESVGDLAVLGAAKGATKAGQEAARIGVIKSTSNAVKAGAVGTVEESATEGYQTFLENSLAGKDLSAEDIYVGATIGGIAGGGIAGGGRALGEILKVTPEHVKAKENQATRDEAQAAAIVSGDVSALVDPKSPVYDPTRAIAALSGHNRQPGVTEETKKSNFEKASKIVADLVTERDLAQKAYDAISPEAQKDYQAQLVQAKADGRQDRIDVLNGLLEDAKNEPADKLRLSKLNKRVELASEQLAIFNTKQALNSIGDFNVAQQVQVANAPEQTPESTAAATRVLNLSMAVPDQVTGEQALALANNTTNGLTANQRAYLRAFADARTVEKDMEEVATEVYTGGNGNLGIVQYRQRITAALNAGNKQLADYYMDLLRKFEAGHIDKADVVAKAWAKGKGTPVHKAKAGGWTIGWAPKGLTSKVMNSPKLVQNIQGEARAATAAVKELEAAYALQLSQPQSPNGGANVQNVSQPSDAAQDPSVGNQGAQATGSLAEGTTGTAGAATAGTGAAAVEQAPVQAPGVDVVVPDSVKKLTDEALNDALNAEMDDPGYQDREAFQQLDAEMSARETAAASTDSGVSNTVTPTESKPEDKVQSTESAEQATEEGTNAGQLTALATKSTEGAEFRQRELIADFFTQVAAKVTDKTKRPLVAVKDFMSSAWEQAKDFIGLKPDESLTEQQQEALSTFQGAFKEWAPEVLRGLRTKSNKEYRYEDLMQFFITGDGKPVLEENLVTAIVYGAFAWTAENATRPETNSKEEINAILLREENHPVSDEEQDRLSHVGARQNVVLNSIGQKVYQALGLKANKDASQDLASKLQSVLGAHALRLLIETGVAAHSEMSADELSKLTGLDVPPGMEHIKHQFIRVARTRDGLNASAQSIWESTRGSQSVLDKLFGVEPGLVDPSFEPIPFTQKSTKNTKQAVPAKLAAIVDRENKQPNYLRQDMWQVLSVLGSANLLAIAGRKPEDESRIHRVNRRAVESKNDGLVRELNSLLDFVEHSLGKTTDALETAIYFPHTVWKQQRVGISSNTVNPQTSKIHRHMLYRPTWKTMVDPTNTEQMEGFYLRVGEGLGIKTDKQSNEVSLNPEHTKSVIQKINDPVIQAAVIALREALAGNGLSAEQQQAVVAGVQAGGENMHSLDALVALAQETKDKPFEVTLTGEVDGVTNGPMLSHLLMGAGETPAQLMDTLNRGGFFQEGGDQNYNTWRGQPGNFDLYERTAKNMVTTVQRFIKDGTKNKWGKTVLHGKTVGVTAQAIYAFTGDFVDSNNQVVKAGRDIVKQPLTSVIFGANPGKVVNAMAQSFVESIYAKVEDLAAGKGKMTHEEVLKHLNTLLDIGGAARLPQSMTLQELMEHEFDRRQTAALKQAFTMTVGQAVEETLKTDFGAFLERRKAVNDTAQAAFTIYEKLYAAMRAQMIDELVESGELAARTNKKGERVLLQDLTAAQEVELRNRLTAVFPVAHTFFSKDSGSLKGGLAISKSARKLSQDDEYSQEVSFTPGQVLTAKSMNTHGYEQRETSPGVGMVVMLVHSADSAISHLAARLGEVLNIHDAHATGIGGFQKTAQNLNQSTWQVMLNYSPATEVANALSRTIIGLSELVTSGQVPVNVSFQISELRGLLEEARKAAFEADNMKLQTMAGLHAIDQYALEGGQYVVTDADRTAAETLRSKLSAELTAEEQAAFAAMEKVKNLDDMVGQLVDTLALVPVKDEPVTATPEPIKPTSSPFGTVGTPAKLNASLVSFFKDKPVVTGAEALKHLASMMGGSQAYTRKLVGMLYKSLPKDVTVKIVTPEMVAGDVAALPLTKSFGWIVGNEIYILGDGFVNSGLQSPEVLLHELVHGALAMIVDNPTGAAVAMVADLQALMEKVAAYAKEKGITEYDSALSDVQEFIAYGMTRKSFQRLLSQVSRNNKRTLVTAMQEFVTKLVGLLFTGSTKTEQEQAETALAELIENVSGLFSQATQAKPAVVGNTTTDGKVTFSKTGDGLIKGVTFKDSNLVVINDAENLTPRQLHALHLHEIGVHYGMERMLGKERFDSLLARMASMRGKSKAIDQAYASVPSNTKPALVNEEALAYLVENRANLPLVREIVADVKTWFKQTFGFSLGLEEYAYLLAKDSLAKHRKQVRIRNTKGLSDKPAEGYVKLNFDDALRASPVMHALLDRVVDALGPRVLLTGSLSMAPKKNIYRPVDEQIHDLDFVYYGSHADLVRDMKSKLPDADLLRAFSGRTGTSVVSMVVPSAGVKILSVVDDRADSTVILGTVNGGDPQMLSTKQFEVIDFFVMSDDVPSTEHTYVGHDGKPRTVQLEDADHTFKAKFSMGRQKDIRDAVLADVGSPTFSRSGAPINLSMAAPTWSPSGNWSRTYSTLDIHGALDGTGVTPTFEAHLRDLLGGIVDKLHGPFGAFKEGLMKNQAITPLDVWAKALATGAAPFASSVMASPLQSSEQEAHALEQVEATMRAALDAGEVSTKGVYRELYRLYEEMRAVIKPSDFASQDEYDFIFKMEPGTDNRSHHLARFAAFGLAHQGFNRLLQRSTAARTKSTKSLSFADRLQRIFEQVLEFFQEKITRTYGGQRADAKLTTLVEQLVDIEAKKRMTISKRSLNNKDGVYGYVEGIMDNVAAGLKSGALKVLDSNAVKNSKSAIIRGTSGVARVYVKDQVEAFVDTIYKLRGAHSKDLHGLAMQVLTEVKGPGQMWDALARMSNAMQSTRKTIITRTAKLATNAFANQGKDLNAQAKASISQVFLRTGMHALLDKFSMVETEQLMSDPAVRHAAATDLESQLSSYGRFKDHFIHQANGLAKFRVSGEVRNKIQMMNAHNIARLYGTAYVGQLTEAQSLQAEAIIEKLVVIYAMDYVDTASMKKVIEIMKEENARTDGGHGVEYVLRMHKFHEKESIERNFAGQRALMMHGYTPEIYNTGTDVRTVTADEGKNLALQGYTMIHPVGRDPADPDQEQMYLYALRDGGKLGYRSGVISFTGKNTKGTKAHSGYMNLRTADGADNAAKQAEINYGKREPLASGPRPNLRSRGPTYMAPVVNSSGEVVNWRYLMHDKTKNMRQVLERDNRFDTILGVLAGSIYDKETTTEMNTKAFQAAKDQYDAEHSKDPGSYVFIGPQVPEPELREIWAMLPDETKAVVRRMWGENGLHVRQDQLTLMFGYRQASLSDMFKKNPAAREHVENAIVSMVEFLLAVGYRAKNPSATDDEAEQFSKRAAVYIVRGEKGWQELVHVYKDNIVIKSVTTMLGNIKSNISLLLLKGVPPMDLAKYHLVALRGARDYFKDSEELFRLQTLLDTDTTASRAQAVQIRADIVKVKDSLARNPVKELIDAGMMPSIVEDVDADDNIYTYKSQLTRKTEKYTSMLNPTVLDIAKQVAMTHDTAFYKGLSRMTQLSDFVARYALYQHQTTRNKNPLTKAQALFDASESFVNYDIPLPRVLQYLDVMGLTMFTKYFQRIQRVLGRTVKEHPGRALMELATARYLGLGPTVLDSSWIAHAGNNPAAWGALEVAGSFDDIATIHAAMALVR